MSLSSIAVITILVIILKNIGYERLFCGDYLYDLGRLMMSFSVFWMYTWVSQHLLIWYSNIPDETSYYVLRHSGAWGYVTFLNVILNWLAPFVMLLPRGSKRSEWVLLQAAICILIGHWLDLYIMVMPAAFPASPPFGIWEVGTGAGSLSLCFWVIFRVLAGRNLVPIKDPYLVECLEESRAHRRQDFPQER